MEEVACYLERQDLANCTLVNKTFHEHFQRHLWRELTINPRVIAERGLMPMQEQVLRNNSRFIRKLFVHTLNRRGVIALLASACDLLYELKSHVSLPKNETDDTLLLMILDLVSHNLRLRNWTIYSRAYFSNTTLLRLTEVLSKSHCLTVLEIELAFRPQRGWMRHILQSLPQTLKNLRIQWERICEMDYVDPFPNNGWPTKYSHLEVADLAIFLTSGDEIALFQFIERCLTLKKLTLPRMRSQLTVDSVISLLETRPLSTTLNTIDLSLVSHLDEIYWGRFLWAMKGRVKELITDMNFNIPTAMTYIPKLTNCWRDTLESLQINKPRRITSRDIYLILTTCSKLKKLDCLYPWVGLRFEREEEEVEFPGLEAMVREDWVCTELEELRLSFADGRRPHAAEPVLSLQEGWCIQGIDHIYQQLGRLTKLRLLAIGWSTTSAFSNRANLDMSLQSGLGYLEGLMSLMSLDIKYIRYVKIQQNEVNWMLENWPSLVRIRGVNNLQVIRSILHERPHMTI
ncbi:hypothetical protein BGZ65_005652 [Modicella reniformis]|uniref:F-box domain-containing protein n=1 Tax=Modicella reniformis TaxID=1440133 RepID=A0A9P6M3E3_9FUNG|nr:hypothetical protein BGZ65_005652 [Modicella reniformis]